jgi:hypothetical protein
MERDKNWFKGFTPISAFKGIVRSEIGGPRVVPIERSWLRIQSQMFFRSINRVLALQTSYPWFQLLGSKSKGASVLRDSRYQKVRTQDLPRGTVHVPLGPMGREAETEWILRLMDCTARASLGTNFLVTCTQTAWCITMGSDSKGRAVNIVQ